MCDLLNERVRINKILNEAIDDGFGAWSMQADEMVQRCLGALEACYHGACADECLKTKASEFVAAHLERRKSEGAALVSQSLRIRTGR